MKRTGKMRNRKKWISAFLSVVLLLSTPGMQAGATEASSETIEEPGQITGVEDAQEVPAEEPAPETPAEDPVSPSAGAPADQFAPPEPDPNLPANTPAELLPVRYLNPGSADLDDICSTVTLSDGKVSLTDNLYGYYLGNGMYFFLSINSSNNYGVKSPDSPYDDGEVDELIDMAMQTGIVTPRMLCANPEELTVYQMYVGEDTAIVGAKYIASWYHDGRDNDGASFNQELGTDVGPGNDVLYDDGMIKRTSFVGEHTTDRVGLQDMQVFGYDASWEVDYEQYKFLFGAEPPLPPGWRYGTEEELKTAWLEANSVMYQVQDLGIPSVERELLESRLRLINYNLKNKPEDWSQEKWEAFQAARENAQRVSQKENATAEEMEEARRNMDRYADYRTYLSFDMQQLIQNEDETIKIRLSRMIKKNSGGEGQNPLYVALLASFAQAYKIDLKPGLMRSPTIRLVVLDEAFSKMDAEKVASCIQLIRGLGFQAIISATNDKIQNYLETVDKIFVFANPNKKAISIQEFERMDFKGLKEELEENLE